MIKMKVERSIVINLPAEEIFAYVTDVDNLAEWSSAVIAVRKTSPGTMCVGETFRGTIRFLGRSLDTTFDIVEFEPGHHLTIKSTSGVAPCVFCYRFVPVEGGETNVTLEAAIQVTGEPVKLAEPVLAGVVRRQIEHDLLTLKDLLEARASVA
jgi:carbon monoxide dehydrogenase subunit G